MSDNRYNKQTISQSGQEITVLFCDTERGYWLKTITEVFDLFNDNVDNLSVKVIVFDFDESISPKDIKPFHLVTLACLIHFLVGYKYKVYMSPDKIVSQYIYND